MTRRCRIEGRDGDLWVNGRKVGDLYHTSIRLFTMDGQDFLDTIQLQIGRQTVFTLRPVVTDGRFVKLRPIEDPEEE